MYRRISTSEKETFYNRETEDERDRHGVVRSNEELIIVTSVAWFIPCNQNFVPLSELMDHHLVLLQYLSSIKIEH